MRKKHARTIPQASPKSPNSDGDGNQIHNEILLSLPREECNMVFSKLEFVRLNHLQVLHEVGDTIRSAYFCNTGMISTLTVFPDGKSVEVGLIGKEGFVGLPLIAGFRSSPIRANVQIAGSAFRIDADVRWIAWSGARNLASACTSFRTSWRCRLLKLLRATDFMTSKNGSLGGCSCARIAPETIVYP